MDRIGQMSRAAKGLAKEPWCYLSIALLYYVGKATLDKYLLEGAPVSGALTFAWERTLAFAQLPLVHLMMIPLALYMFGHGVRRVMRHREEAENRSVGIFQSKIDDYRSEMAPIFLAIRYVTEMQYLDSVTKKIDSLEILISQTDRGIADFINSLPFEVRDGELAYRLPTRNFSLIQQSAMELQIANPIGIPVPALITNQTLSKRDTTPPTVPGLGRSPAPRGVIDHDSNIPVFDEWRRQLDQFREFGAVVRQNVRDRRLALQTIIETIRKKHEQ